MSVGEGDTSSKARRLSASGGSVAEARVSRQLSYRVHPLENGVPPAWASAWGQDRYGVWAGFAVGDVLHRMRFIPPGSFVMGSPEGESGRYDDEGPQHQVKISRGFFLGETPCTQALWQAVMGANPGRFVDPRRPVENVSWNDCQAFIAALNERVPSLGVHMPTEAEWEYACRAGTATATYVGDLEILGRNNAPMLDAIAWYGGNCGVEFELEGGWDTTGELWEDKQYAFERGGSHPVGGKQPNPWCLYDMLGNVLEWCDDGLRTYGKEAVTDPSGPREEGSPRVVRGGPWDSDARGVRAACRDGLEPGRRYDALGLRVARGQE